MIKRTYIYNRLAVNNKILHVEGLRGGLALIVVINHFILLFCPIVFSGSYDLSDFVNSPTSLKILLANSPLNIFMNGHFAVCAFFTISGYVLTLSYRKSNLLQTLQKNVLKRYIRLVIPVLSTCLVIYVLFLTNAFSKANYPVGDSSLSFGQSLFKSEPSFFSMIKMALFDVPISGNNTYLPVLWTIQIEFIGVLILYAFLMLTHNLNKKWIYGLIIIFVSILISKYYFLLLIVGSLICISEEKIKVMFANKFYKLLFLVAFLFFAGIPNLSKDAKAHTLYAFTNKFAINLYPYFHDLACTFLLLLLVSSNSLKKILSFKMLANFGKLSFSIYLLHLPILYCLGTYLMRMNNGKINYFLLYIICFAVVLLISFIFYKLIDKTSISLSNKFTKKIMPLNKN